MKNLFIAFTTKKDGKFYEKLQAIEYLPELGRYHSLELNFKPSPDTTDKADTDVGSCISCHGPRFRPQWGDYAFWPESFEGRHDMYEDFLYDRHEKAVVTGTGSSTIANNYFKDQGKALCDFAESDERLALFADSINHQCDFILKRKEMPTFRIEADALPPYRSSPTYAKTRRLTDALGLTMVESFVFALNKAFPTEADRKRFGPALAGALYSCGEFESFFPKEWNEWFKKRSGKTVDELIADTKAASESDFKRRFAMLFFTDKTTDVEKKSWFEKYPMSTSRHSINEQLYRSIAALRYFVDPNPVNSKDPFITETFSLSREKGKNSYSLNQTGAGEHNRFVEYHALLESWGQKMSKTIGYYQSVYSYECTGWREDSLKQLKDFAPPAL